MGNLSKLTSGFSFGDINFGGFSTSASWVGYFEKNKEFSYALVDEAVDLFESFFRSKSERGVVVTALSFDDEREEDDEVIRRYQHLYEEMKEKRLLLPMSESFECYLYGETCLPVSSLSLSFERSDFTAISKLLMCHTGVVGQVGFYIDPLLSVAIYPHDDIGFGCIALNSDDGICREFLNHCSRSGSFNVVVGDEI
ncbi:hypothetical protein [Pseudomonas sp. ES1]